MEREELSKLAHDCLTMTLHGPVPMKTTAALAQGVLGLVEQIKKLEEARTAEDERADVVAWLLKYARDNWYPVDSPAMLREVAPKIEDGAHVDASNTRGGEG